MKMRTNYGEVQKGHSTTSETAKAAAAAPVDVVAISSAAFAGEDSVRIDVHLTRSLWLTKRREDDEKWQTYLIVVVPRAYKA